MINPEYKHCTKFQEAYAFVKPTDDEEAKGSSQGLTEDFMIIDANGNVVSSNSFVSLRVGTHFPWNGIQVSSGNWQG